MSSTLIMRQRDLGSDLTLPVKSHLTYRPSGVEWLGDVPEHWDVRRLKGHAMNVVDLTRETCESDIHIALEHVESWTGRFTAASNGVGFDSQVKRFRAGDVLFGKLRPYLAKVTCPNQEGVCVGEFLVLRPSIADLSPRYLEQLLRSRPVIDAIDASTFGAKMPRADWQFIGDMPIPLPPLPEQRAIVRYLDYVDRRIRRYVAAKRKLIVLLEEEKQAVVNRAVTRGLDPNVRLKPSGVEWLGDVPEHWDIMRARFLFQEVDTRSTSGRETHLSMSQTLGLVPSNLVEQSLISDSYVGGKLCQDGDLVLNRLKAHLGVFALAKQAGVISPDYSVFRKRDSVNMEYFFRVLRVPALRTELRIRSKGIVEGFWRLYTDDFFDIRLPVPPSVEQAAIVEHLDEVIISINAAIARTRHQVELVEEYRMRLIADVVTGKLDVREAAEQLPDEAENDVPLGESGPQENGLAKGPYDAEKEPAITEEVTT